MSVATYVEACVRFGDPNDASRVENGARDRDGHQIWLGLDAYAHSQGTKIHFDQVSAGYTDADYVRVAREVLRLPP